MNKDLLKVIFKAVALGTGISTLVLSIMGKVQSQSAISLLSIGVTCLAIVYIQDK